MPGGQVSDIYGSRFRVQGSRFMVQGDMDCDIRLYEASDAIIEKKD